MIRTINTCDKSVTTVPALTVVCADSTSTDVLADLTKTEGEFVERYIQNIGGNPAFYAEGQDCDGATSVHGILAVGQQLNCSGHCQRVNVFSVGGTTIAPTVRRRIDLGVTGSNILDSMP